MELQVVRADDEITHLTLVGRLDIGGVAEIESQFLETAAGRKKPLLMDFSQVTFLTSMGLRMLLAAAKVLEADKIPMVVFQPDPKVEKVLRIGGLDQFMTIEQDEATALERCTKPGS